MSIAEKLQTIAENEQRVYEAGKAHGETVGRKAQYDEFWDNFQNYGKRTDYKGSFGRGFNDFTFKPKYDIAPQWAANGMFQYCEVTDLEKILNDCGVSLDLRLNSNLSDVFANSKITVLPELDFTGPSGTAVNLYSTFAEAGSLHTIRKIKLSSTIFAGALTSAFTNCKALANIEFEGVIGKAINLQWCPLTKASITNVIEHLATSTSEQTATFSKTAVETAFGSTTSEEWLALVATKSNWTISLV